MRRRTLLVFGALVVSPAAMNAAMELAGYTVAEQEPRFCLQDPVAKDSSRWLKIGDSFRGHTILAFDSANETLSLHGPEGVLLLRIRGTAIQTASNPGTSAAAPDSETIQLNGDGSYVYAGRTMTIEQLRPELFRLSRLQPVPMLRLQMSAKSPFALSVALLDEVRKSGITKVSIATEGLEAK